MPLQYPADWKFRGIGVEMPPKADREFFELITQIAAGQGNARDIFEIFKSAFGKQGPSTSTSWAETDLASAMDDFMSNAPRYVEALWNGIERVGQTGVEVPSAQHINSILQKYDVPLVIDPPHLRQKEGDIVIASQANLNSESSAVIYKRGEILGQGGFGTVYQVSRTTQAGEFTFAMKVLDPSPFNKNPDRALQRFRREMQVLSKLNHRGIIPHIEAGLDGDRKHYILMPLIQGVDLQRAHSSSSPRKVFEAFAEILAALDYAHREGVVHRDLKPSNILVRSTDGQPIILDFGCAYLFDELSEESLTSTLVGSMQYIPIEVLRDPKHRTPKQDIYACGMLLYQVLAGRLPDPTDYQPIEDEVEECSGIDEVIRKAIAPEKRRIESASDFLTLLREMPGK